MENQVHHGAFFFSLCGCKRLLLCCESVCTLPWQGDDGDHGLDGVDGEQGLIGTAGAAGERGNPGRPVNTFSHSTYILPKNYS